MEVEVSKVNEIQEGKMRRVSALGRYVLLSNVGGKIYATQDACGHQKVSLSKGSLSGTTVTCPLHGAQFDVASGRIVSSPKLGVHSDAAQNLPPEMIANFKKIGELISEVEVEPLKTYKVQVRGNSVFIDDPSNQ